MSSVVNRPASRAFRAATSIPDERLRSGRSTGKYTSLQVAADQGKTQRSRATPNSSATSAAMRMKAAAMSTDMMLLSSLG
ncbi:Uncharacterised protein [Mycobacteroides abscessus subsp. abscessus]|nr:Uncharacterised protein [Mycobacteroides abscessus subsp. abscessus]